MDSTLNSKARLATGIGGGLFAATVSALYTVFARFGMLHGLAPHDMTFLRYGVAGFVTAPVLVYHITMGKTDFMEQRFAWIGIALLAGPLFGLTIFSAFEFAPPSHAAIFPTSAMSVMGTLLAAPFLADRLTKRKIGGMAIVILGLLIISDVSGHSFDSRSMIGDLLFVLAGTMWAGFGILLRKYKLDPLLATAVVSFFALITYVPVYLYATGAANLRNVAPSIAWLEILIQGVLAGAGTLYSYAKAVQILGAGRAAIFPALAPGIATLLSWPVLGSIPRPSDVLGLAIAIVGLLISVTGHPPEQKRS